MSTVLDLIVDSLMLSGLADPGVAPDAYMVNVVLRRLNAMMAAWSADELMVFTASRNVLPLTIDQASYTLGTGGALNIPRPVWFNMASVIPSSSPTLEIPVEILSDEDWQRVGIKSVASNFPVQIHPRGDYPLNTIDVWPVPTQACSLVLYTPEQIEGFPTVETAVSLPPGYEEAITYNLNVRINPIFGKTTSQEVLQIAHSSKDTLKAQNLTPKLLRVDSALCGGRRGPSEQAIRSKGYFCD